MDTGGENGMRRQTHTERSHEEKTEAERERRSD